MTVTLTGHRPDKLGGYTPEVWRRAVSLAHDWLFKRSKIDRALGLLSENDGSLSLNDGLLVVSGMAPGWDQAGATAAHLLGIPFDAYVPFEGQEAKWNAKSQAFYRKLLSKARKVVVVCEGGFAQWKYQKRNEAMVDVCDLLLSLHDGSPGGTANCISYASGKVPIVNLWDRWSA